MSKNGNLNGNLTTRTALDIAREVFPNERDQYLLDILWCCTGYPCFWQENPAAELRQQLTDLRDSVKRDEVSA